MAKKYIDADRLKAEMEKRMHICDGIFERDSDTYYQGKAVAYQETLSFIDSLQQEQPREDLEAETSYDTQLYTPRPSVDIGDVARVQFAAHAKVFDKKRKAVFDWEQFKEVAGIFYGFGKKDSLKTEEREQPCDTCTNDKGCVTCKDGELWEGKEQSCEDLEKEIANVFFSQNYEDDHGRFSVQLSLNTFKDVARHFYELGKKSHWKPSEEQMEALKEDIDFAPDTYKLRCTLVSLYNELKKLI